MTLQEQFEKEEGWAPYITGGLGGAVQQGWKHRGIARSWQEYFKAYSLWLESKVEIALGGLKGAGAGFMQIEMIGGRKDGNFFRDRMEMSEMSAVWYSNTRQTINQIKGSDK